MLGEVGFALLNIDSDSSAKQTDRKGIDKFLHTSDQSSDRGNRKFFNWKLVTKEGIINCDPLYLAWLWEIWSEDALVWDVGHGRIQGA